LIDLNDTKEMKKIAISFVLTLFMATFAMAQVDRSQFPNAGPAPQIKIGDAETFTLENGLKVFVVKNTKLPRVSFTLVLERDPILEGDKAGMSDFVGEMMTAGTTTRSKDQLDQEIDFIGASLSASATSIFASSLKKHQGKVLELMADVLYNPVFPEAELEKLKKQSLTGLAQSKDSPDAISQRLTSALVYGKNHPYGEVATEATIGNVTVADVKQYYQTYFKPNIAYLAIVGDMDKAEAESIVKKHFGSWKKGQVPTATYPIPQRQAKNTVALVDRSSSVQTVIDIAQPLQMKIGDSDYITSRVLNEILGGGSSSRLFLNLREDKGYTYGAYSSISADKLTGSFSANASVRTEVTDSAVYEFMHEIVNLVDNGVTEEELVKAKSSIAGSFGRSLENPSTIANFALNTERYKLPKDYYATYLQKMNALTVADLNAAAKKMIDPSKLYVTVVGNGSEIKEKMAQFGEVIEYDNMGFVAKKIEMSDASVTAERVIENYLAAIGGKEKASQIKAAKVSLAANVMGTALGLSFVYDDANGRFAQKTSVAGNVMQSSIIKNGEGSVSAQGQTIQMTPEQVAAGKLSSYLLPELYYGALSYTITLDGIKDVEGTQAYKIIVKTPEGPSTINYYAVETGLKIKNEDANSGDTFYSDYQEQNGVLIPRFYTIKSPMIPVPLEAKMESLEVNPTLTDADFN
jgi:predicted Zn-dependent peptidase